MIDEDLKEEFYGQIIDIFDDYLEEKYGKKVSIVGDDYTGIRNALADMMENWGVTKEQEDKDREQ